MSTTTNSIKAGQLFYYFAVLKDGEVPITGASASLISQVRQRLGHDLIATLHVTEIDTEPGKYMLFAMPDETRAWPEGFMETDFWYMGDDPVPSPTTEFRVERSVTEWQT